MSVDPVCVKCGGKDVHLRWLPAVPAFNRYARDCTYQNADEHLHHYCRRCGYEWDGPLTPPSPLP